MIERLGPLPRGARAWHTHRMGLASYPTFERPRLESSRRVGLRLEVDL
jgi:hypothetical protein